MTLSIYTNVSSLNAQRNLATNSSTLQKSMQRLSSGLRVNSASDDAAGLAISVGMTAQKNGLDQAIRNSNDGLSLLGTADAALSTQTDLLQRMRELAVQASSDTNNGTNRAQLNEEVMQLKGEFDRVAKTTQFNGINLLDGTFTSKDIQAGAYSGNDQKISIDISGSRSSSIGTSYSLDNSSAVGNTVGSNGDVKITSDGQTYDVSKPEADGVSTNESDTSAIAWANAINAISGNTGVTATAESTTITGAVQDNTAGTPAGQIDDGELKINGVNIGAVSISGANDTAVITAINNKSSQTGVTAALGSDNKITLTAEDGRNIQVAVSGDAGSISGLSSGTTHGSISLKSYKGTFSVSDASSRINLSGASSVDSDAVSTVDVSTKDGALAAIDTIDGALEQINTRRAAVGAQTNRLNSVSSNLSAASENVSSAISRIKDADFASETANMTSAQILQQASVAVLAQANSTPQLALSLLK